MNWFSKSATVEVEPETPAVDPAAERLEQIEAELPARIAARGQARKELRELRQHIKDPRVDILPSGLFAAVGAMTMPCPHAVLEALQRKADAEVDAMLWERAQLRRKLGLTK